jgi:hypothetical protein
MHVDTKQYYTLLHIWVSQKRDLINAVKAIDIGIGS